MVSAKLRGAISELLWQNTEKKRSEVAGKGGEGGQSADSGFSAYSVYHMILELILWCHGASHSGSSGRMRP